MRHVQVEPGDLRDVEDQQHVQLGGEASEERRRPHTQQLEDSVEEHWGWDEDWRHGDMAEHKAREGNAGIGDPDAWSNFPDGRSYRWQAGERKELLASHLVQGRPGHRFVLRTPRHQVLRIVR